MDNFRQSIEYWLDKDLSFDPIFQDFIWENYDHNLSRIFHALYNSHNYETSCKLDRIHTRSVQFLPGYYFTAYLNCEKPGYVEIYLYNNNYVYEHYYLKESKFIHHIKLLTEYCKEEDQLQE